MSFAPSIFLELKSDLAGKGRLKPPSWLISEQLISYPLAITRMTKHVRKIQYNQGEELVWFLQHPPLYTAGTSAKDYDLLDKLNIPVYKTDRGGQYTYHGPGQLIIYLMLDLNKRGKDIKAFVRSLEYWVIHTLKNLGLNVIRREGRIGLWVIENSEKKISSIGIRVSRWVTYHGISINVYNDLQPYEGIVPCGIKEYGVTNLWQQNIKVTITELIEEFKKTFNDNVLNF